MPVIATIPAASAKFERELVSERVKAGLEAARAGNKKLGRQPGPGPESGRLAPKLLQLIDWGRSYQWIAHYLSIRKNTLAGIVKPRRANP